MAHIAIVYHSGWGHTAEQAKAVVRGGARVVGSQATLIAVDQIEPQWDTLVVADAIIFGCPTYMGSASAQFKTFMDASSKVWFAQGWKGKISAGWSAR